LELVDGPKDMRFAMTAATLARRREEGVSMNEVTALNVKKVTQFREGGEEELERMVEEIAAKKGGLMGKSRGRRSERAGSMEEEFGALKGEQKDGLMEDTKQNGGRRAGSIEIVERS
jgi:hypothetical protein